MIRRFRTSINRCRCRLWRGVYVTWRFYELYRIFGCLCQLIWCRAGGLLLSRRGCRLGFLRRCGLSFRCFIVVAFTAGIIFLAGTGAGGVVVFRGDGFTTDVTIWNQSSVTEQGEWGGGGKVPLRFPTHRTSHQITSLLLPQRSLTVPNRLVSIEEKSDTRVRKYDVGLTCNASKSQQ